jgi:hypothetical protein
MPAIDKREKTVAVYSILVFLLIIDNPVIAPLGLRFFGEDLRSYLRIYYLLPLMTVIACGLTEFYVIQVKPTDGNRKKMIYIAVLVITVIISGKTYDKSMYIKPDNIYKINQEALEISEIIDKDSERMRVGVLLPNSQEIVYGIRQYTGTVVVAGFSDTIHNKSTLQEMETQCDFQYVVLNTDDKTDILLQSFQYEDIGKTESYTVYKRMES